MSKFTIGVEWKMYGYVTVEASSKENALVKAKEESLPTDGDYLDDSFIVDADSIIEEKEDN